MKVVLLLIGLCWAGLTSAPAAAQAPLDSEVKAAYIYRFLDYVTWPPQSFRNADDPLLIGTMQNDDVAAELARLTRERTVQGRRLQLVVVKDEREPGVHALYVPRVEAARAARVLDAARQRPILVVTDHPEGLERGGVINFVPAAGRIQFEVSLEAAARTGLEISSRLLAVAIRVKKGEYGRPLVASMPPQNVLASTRSVSTIGEVELRDASSNSPVRLTGGWNSH
jgi:hypothetical protein